MTTVATTVTNVRRILQDAPDEDYLAAAVAATSTTTLTPTDVTKYAVGNVWEFDDSTGDQFLVRSVDAATPAITVKRGHNGSTAATHSNGVVVLKNPRFSYDVISQAINTVLDVDLRSDGVYDIVEHQVTSSASTDAYNAPSSSCLEFLWVYQKINTNDGPLWQDLVWTRLPKNVDSALWSNGKVFEIVGNYGTPGTDLYYVNCKHDLTISTLTSRQERIVQFLACAYVLEWTEPRRMQGPTNQGDRTVRPGTGVGTASYYRQLAQKLVEKEKADLRKVNPPYRTFKRA